jgi:hypothetical protein
MRRVMNATLALLLSPLYSGALAPAHRADLDKSGLTLATIYAHAIRAVPAGMIDRLSFAKTPSGGQVVDRSALIMPRSNRSPS